jgi:hypothetical protein
MRKPLIVFAVSALLGAFAGLVAFRVVLSFTPIGERLQGTFTEACRWGDTGTMAKFFAAGASVNGRFPDGGPEGPTGYSPDPPLYQAAEFGSAHAVQWLVDHGADVNVTIDGGDSVWSPLDIAEDHLKEAQRTVDILKAHGAKSAFRK